MNTENNSQLELFDQDNIPAKSKTHSSGVPFFRRVRGYEKTVLFLCGIIIISIISFSLGVERGKTINKQTAAAKNTVLTRTAQPQLPVRLVKQPVNLITPATVNPAPIKTLPRPAGSYAINQSAQGFTIQVASFKTRDFAKREAELLKRKGLNPIILPKGNFTILCVGNFNNKEQASPLLSELKKRYPGCYIRRL